MRTDRIVLVLVLSTAAAGAETPRAGTAFRTPWGDPDLQGIWSNATLTPLERPDGVEEEFLTEAEAEEVNRTGMERTLAPIQVEVRASGELNDAYMELGRTVRTRRTSLVVDPPDGKIPFTDAGRQQRNRALAQAIGAVPQNSHEDRGLNDRCLLTGVLLLPNPFYLNNHQIFQTRDHVAIKSESMNETRIVPLDGRPGLDPRVQLWSGSSRGRWEGDTLVVETTNYNDKGRMLASSSGLRTVERFTRVDSHTIDYEVTVTDPVMYTRPWTYVNTLRAIEGPIYEYACHEGNYSMFNILEGARAKEKAAAQTTPGETPLETRPAQPTPAAKP